LHDIKVAIKSKLKKSSIDGSNLFLYLFELSFDTLKRDASLKFETSKSSAQVILCEKRLEKKKE
jgi:hypothetical protein